MKAKKWHKTNVWYEVFMSDEKEGTHTIQNCATMQEARLFKHSHLSAHPEDKGKLFIDKWGT